MMAREITKEQVTYLHEFCKKKDIHYVDLRIELVDHLCELIQAEWDKNPNLRFRDAFHNVYKGFGVFGFMHIAEEHEQTVRKRYWKEMWLFFKKWITPPRVFLTLSVSVAIYFLLIRFPFLNTPMAIATAAIFIGSVFYYAYQFVRNKRILGEQNILMGGGRQAVGWFIYFIYF